MPILDLLRLRTPATLFAALVLAGCSDSKPELLTSPLGQANRCVSLDGGEGAVPGCGQWVKVELPGKVCGDGSPYKFFVSYSNSSNNLVISFEPGGACWDYESCSGAGGIRGAANPHGIPDNHMERYQFLNLLQQSEQNPAQDYNMVFVPYCTGDIHTGDNVITYRREGGDGGTDSLTFHHKGHENVLAVVDWVKKHFTNVPKLLVTGCSAGGAGAIINYHFIRRALGSAVQRGYLLDDSGPIFHSDGPSKQLHEKVRASWKVDPILDSLDGELSVSSADLKKDFGLLNTALARKYPHDRLSIALYRMDLNYSLYSYQRFFPGSTEADIHAKWWQDIQGMMATYDAEPNMAYYIPYFRSDNCSHCVSIPPLDHLEFVTSNPWFGSEIEADKLSLEDFTRTLLDDRKPLKSYLEDVQSSEEFTSEESAKCMEGG